MIGGLDGGWGKHILRKCRNTFFCKTGKPFTFLGRFEDVTTPSYYNSVGEIFATVTDVMISALPKEKNHGGMAAMKTQNISYFEFWYAVMWMPSAIKLKRVMAEGNHQANQNFNNIVPKILSERYKKRA